MLNQILYFVTGVLVGGFAGMIILGVCVAARNTANCEDEYKAAQEPGAEARDAA